jgi:hypothetical protein
MEIKDGTTRQVLLVGPLVIKVPREIFLFVRVRIRSIFRHYFAKGYKKYDYQWKQCLYRIKAGLESNKTESELWNENSLNYLAPVYIRFTNWILISKRVDGESVGWDEIQSRVRTVLSEDEMIYWTGHTAYSDDWIRTPKGIILVDYGSPGDIVNKMITKYKDALGEALAN